MLDVGYYGNNAHHLLGVVDINQVMPGRRRMVSTLPPLPAPPENYR